MAIDSGFHGGIMKNSNANAERERLDADAKRLANWKRWGPYLSERQWGTVREDYSEGGQLELFLPRPGRSRGTAGGRRSSRHYGPRGPTLLGPGSLE